MTISRCSAAGSTGDVYELDDDGYNLHRGSYVEVPPGLEESARYGANVCPERIITIEE